MNGEKMIGRMGACMDGWMNGMVRDGNGRMNGEEMIGRIGACMDG